MTAAPQDEPAAQRAGSITVAAGIFLFAAALRWIYVFALREHPGFGSPTMDPGFHLAWAQALSEGREFLDGPFFRAPLYPVTLAGMWKVTGGSLLGVRLIQALLGALTAALTYRLGCRVAGEGAGRLAGLLVAVSWTLVSFDAELLIPVVLLPILLVGLELSVAWLAAEPSATREGSSTRLPMGLLIGLIFGLAAIARPNVLLFMPVLFGGALLSYRRIGPALWLTVGTLIPIAPVAVHNVLEGDPSLIATQGGVNFWIGNSPSSDGSAAIVPGTRDGWWEGYFDSIAMAEAEAGRALKPTEVSAHYRSKALGWMTAEPGAALRHFAWKARLMAANAELANNQDMRFLAFRTFPPLRFSPARWGLLFGFGVIGLALLMRSPAEERRRGARLLALFGVVYALSVVLFFVNARFRLPLVPILSIGTGAALIGLFDAVRQRRWQRVLAVGLPAAALSTLSFIPPAGYVSSDANGLSALAKAELARGNVDAAVRYLEQAIDANPASVQVRMALAQALLVAGADPERSLILLREARELPRGKDLAELEVQILDTRLSAGDVEGALAAAQAALSARPEDGALRFVVARGYAMTGRARLALKRLEELLVDEPTNASVALAIAEIHEGLGEREKAIAAYRRLVALKNFASAAMIAQAQEKLARLDR